MLNKFYFIMVVSFMLVFPCLSIIIESDKIFSWTLIGKWFIFWGVGVRLLLTGIKQVLNPKYTAEEILGIKEKESYLVIKELGFSNVCFGIGGVLSIINNHWLPIVGIIGGLYYAFAGILHIFNKKRKLNENIAMISDMGISFIILLYLVNK